MKTDINFMVNLENFGEENFRWSETTAVSKLYSKNYNERVLKNSPIFLNYPNVSVYCMQATKLLHQRNWRVGLHFDKHRIAIDRYNKSSAILMSESTRRKDATDFTEKEINFNGVSENIKSDWRSALLSHEWKKEKAKHWNVSFENLMALTVQGARTTHPKKMANLDKKLGFTGRINQALPNAPH